MLNRYSLWLLHHHRFIVIGSIFCVAILAIGAKNLSITNDLRVYFSVDNPQLARFDQMETTYNKQDNVVFLLLPNDKNVYSSSVVHLIWELTDAVWRLPHAQRVTSLANYQHTYARGDELVTQYLIESATNITPERIQQIRHIAVNEPTLRNLIPESGIATLINTI